MCHFAVPLNDVYVTAHVRGHIPERTFTRHGTSTVLYTHRSTHITVCLTVYLHKPWHTYVHTMAYVHMYVHMPQCCTHTAVYKSQCTWLCTIHTRPGICTHAIAYVHMPQCNTCTTVNTQWIMQNLTNCSITEISYYVCIQMPWDQNAVSSKNMNISHVSIHNCEPTCINKLLHLKQRLIQQSTVSHCLTNLSIWPIKIHYGWIHSLHMFNRDRGLYIQ